MARAVLHVQEQVYCEIDIEDTPMPKTPNFIDKIHIVEGLGQAVPVLELFLYDQTGSLADELSLFEGKKISLTLGKSGSKNEKRSFRIFGFSTLATHAGPLLKVSAIFDCYKFIAESHTKSFDGTSDSVMSQVAGLCSFKYDGPGATSDKMVWLNVCQTYSTFVEDVAAHGYVSGTSCMKHTISSKKVLLYKDLFKILKEQHKYTLKHNAITSGSNEFIIREINTLSRGGVVSHWLNYGHAQFEHDLTGKPTKNLKANPPITQGFPVNKIRDEMEFSRRDYLGLDTGLNDKPSGNVHKEYRKASYQNLRYYALFTDGLRILLEQYSDIELFDNVKVDYVDLKHGTFTQNDRFSGNYLVANKTIVIKNGIRYSEVLTVTRPNVGNAK